MFLEKAVHEHITMLHDHLEHLFPIVQIRSETELLERVFVQLGILPVLLDGRHFGLKLRGELLQPAGHFMT